MRPLYAALLLVPIALVGCAPTLLSNDKLQSSTAGVLGVPSSDVAITDRRDDGMTNTYYTATANGRSYACTVNGGSILDAGLTTPPTCNAK